MEQEKILSLILSKLDNIEKEQQKMNGRLDRIEDGQEVIKKDISEMKSVQKTIQEFILSTEKAIEIYKGQGDRYPVPPDRVTRHLTVTEGRFY